jgi:hypothetical protein
MRLIGTARLASANYLLREVAGLVVTELLIRVVRLTASKYLLRQVASLIVSLLRWPDLQGLVTY